MANNDLISRSSLIEIGAARKIIEVVGNWNELPGIAKAACTRLGIAHRKLILDAPAVDAVPVVRCRDCFHRHSRPTCAGRPMDFFCADGERRRADYGK